MKNFVLVDGAMAYGTVSTRQVFKAPDAEWLAALMPHEAQRLAGPLLLDTERINSLPAWVSEAHRVVAAFPLRLHMSVIDSELGLKELAEHLRRFIHFSDDQGETYGLRIADCRVLAYLPQVLSADQWDALTAPIQRWSIHDRTGKQVQLSLDETRHARQTPSSIWHLNADQIERLIDAGEADALLALLGKSPEATPPADIQRYFALASQCVEHWRAGGGKDRGQLLELGRRAFANQRAKR
ncbi:DUF4123 domain-containing protein [Variovorax ginsengisoli]|uniref:DUF4123 domain-containing protein n=1 Tax=Variovorax ginsengisoli TaxID=363844 RepID=A0ABT9SGG8_9BURK|nr:DUF4123 domain-containing protein [Variovorax ginsengisoli]MDP9902507.1 hypothetical protein [Variovorax ginsengisoli]